MHMPNGGGFCFWHFGIRVKLFEKNLEGLMSTENFHAIFKWRGTSAAKDRRIKPHKYARMSSEPTECR